MLSTTSTTKAVDITSYEAGQRHAEEGYHTHPQAPQGRNKVKQDTILSEVQH